MHESDTIRYYRVDEGRSLVGEREGKEIEEKTSWIIKSSRMKKRTAKNVENKGNGVENKG